VAQHSCASAKCHTSDKVAVYLWEHRERIELHLLPKSSPNCNPIEREWRNLYDRITWNHRCETMEELLDLTFAWLGSRNPFQSRRSGVQKRRVVHFPVVWSYFVLRRNSTASSRRGAAYRN
jgi:DDE superfamily endonuclease